MVWSAATKFRRWEIHLRTKKRQHQVSTGSSVGQKRGCMTWREGSLRWFSRNTREKGDARMCGHLWWFGTSRAGPIQADPRRSELAWRARMLVALLTHARTIPQSPGPPRRTLARRCSSFESGGGPSTSLEKAGRYCTSTFVSSPHAFWFDCLAGLWLAVSLRKSAPGG